MRLKRIADFIRDHTCEPHPKPETVRRWPGARKLGGKWYVDLDEWTVHFTPSDEIRELEKKPALAALLEQVS